MFKRNRSRRKSQILKKRRLKRFRVFLVLVSFFLVIVFSGSCFLKAEPVVISEININGNFTVNRSVFLSVVNDQIAGSYFSIFPKNSVLLYPKEKIEQDILEKIKKVNEVKVSRGGLSSIEIDVRERKSHGTWCVSRDRENTKDDEIGSLSEVAPPNEVALSNEVAPPNEVERERVQNHEERFTPRCFFIDKEGIIFEEAPNFSGDVYFKYYTRVLGKERGEILGKRILEKSEFLKVEKFVKLLKEELDLAPSAVIEMEENDFSVDLKNGASILFSIDFNVDAAVKNLESALLSGALLEVGTEGVEYIDLRFEGKVFYRLK